MKHKELIIASIAFFLLVNFNFSWKENMGFYAMFFALGMLVIFFVLAIVLLLQLNYSIKEKFSDKQRLAAIMVLAGVLITAWSKPNGLINFDKFSGKDMLVAKRGGVASCMTFLKLKQDKSFVFQENCFGTSKTTGKYEIKADSIFFIQIKTGRERDSFYRFGILKSSITGNTQIKNSILLYHSQHDTLGYLLGVTENQLVK